MAPTLEPKDEVLSLIKGNKVMFFSKTTCPYCRQIKELFNSLKIEYHAMEINLVGNGQAIQSALFEISGQKTVPNIFINGKHVGGADATMQAHAENKLFALINQTDERAYDYDLVVIGGGSGGLAASKQAADLGKKVLLCDFVKPTPKGTSWGLGGTCVNVGCIPKKLMHQGSLLGKSIKEAKAFGWDVSDEKANHNWETMVQGVQDYIGSLNWGYRVEVRNKKVEYLNAYAELTDAHTVKTKNRRGVEKTVTTQDVLIAVGERPRYPPHIPNVQEYSITSDDLFSLPFCPGKTLVVGASYVALECACFLKGVGLDVTVMVRSIFLRGFDQGVAEKIGEHMKENQNIKIVRRFVPTSIEQIEEGTPGKYRVTAKSTESEETFTDEFNTIIFAIGRDPCTRTIGLDNAGVMYSKSGKIPVDDNDSTNVPNIYCIGDCAEGRPELTPVAILAGNLLSKRLYTGSEIKCDYKYIPTTVFTSIEYSCCGLAEEDAEKQYGADNLEIYHTNFTPLEWTVPASGDNLCYCKVIVNMQDNNRIVGMHYLGPDAGEVMQGFAAALRLGLTKEQLDLTVGIHPTNAEIFTTMHITKRSGKSIVRSGC